MDYHRISICTTALDVMEVKNALNEMFVSWCYNEKSIIRYYHANFGVIWTSSYRVMLSQDKHEYQGKRYY